MKTISKMDIRAFILDLDGVVTHTAKLHAVAWKQLFDEFNGRREREGYKGFEPFDAQNDYLRYVDGKPREDGIKDFLNARGIRLPLGHPNDAPAMQTVYGLGNRKNELFQRALEKMGAHVFPDAVEALKTWRKSGFKTAIASSSKNCEKILNTAKISDLFDVRVDGNYIEKWNLHGKPAPDLFIAAACLLEVPALNAAVLEDAIAGVKAARAGNFGLVVGVARFGHPELLRAAGADVTLSKLTELKIQRQQKVA